MNFGLPEIAFITGLLIVPLILAVLYIVGASRTRSIQQAAIDKFASAQDFASFVQTPAGQRFMHSISGGKDPLQAALKSIRVGTVCCLAGIGLIAAASVAQAPAFTGFGLLLVFLGAGFVIAAFVSRRLAQSWTTDGR